MGVMIGTHPRSNEMAHVLYPFKDLFLLGFFMSVGLDYGPPTGMAAGLCAFFLALSWLKFYQFYGFFLGFAMRNYSAYSCALSLSNYSEFALIVMDIGVDKGWLDPYWMVVTALTVSMSWAIGSPIISRENVFYDYRCCRLQCERKERIPGEEPVDIGNANIMIVGMGRVGTAVYHELCNDEEGEINDRIVGIEASPDIVVKHRSKGLHVLLGDALDFDFWARCGGTQDQIKLLLLTMDSHSANLMVCSNFRERKFSGFIAATARYNDKVEALKKNGAHIAFDVFAEAGSGFAGHVLEEALSHFGDIIHDSTQEEEPSQETKEFHNWLYHTVKHDLEFGRQSNNHSPEGTELHKKAADRLFSITSRTRKIKKSSKGRSGERSKRHDLKSIPAPSAREDSLGHGNDEEDDSEHTVNFIPAPTNESNNPGRVSAWGHIEFESCLRRRNDTRLLGRYDSCILGLCYFPPPAALGLCYFHPSRRPSQLDGFASKRRFSAHTPNLRYCQILKVYISDFKSLFSKTAPFSKFWEENFDSVMPKNKKQSGNVAKSIETVRINRTLERFLTINGADPNIKKNILPFSSVVIPEEVLRRMTSQKKTLQVWRPVIATPTKKGKKPDPTTKSKSAKKGKAGKAATTSTSPTTTTSTSPTTTTSTSPTTTTSTSPTTTTSTSPTTTTSTSPTTTTSTSPTTTTSTSPTTTTSTSPTTTTSTSPSTTIAGDDEQLPECEPGKIRIWQRDGIFKYASGKKWQDCLLLKFVMDDNKTREGPLVLNVHLMKYHDFLLGRNTLIETCEGETGTAPGIVFVFPPDWRHKSVPDSSKWFLFVIRNVASKGDGVADSLQAQLLGTFMFNYKFSCLLDDSTLDWDKQISPTFVPYIGDPTIGNCHEGQKPKKKCKNSASSQMNKMNTMLQRMYESQFQWSGMGTPMRRQTPHANYNNSPFHSPPEFRNPYFDFALATMPLALHPKQFKEPARGSRIDDKPYAFISLDVTQRTRSRNLQRRAETLSARSIR
eukprot:g13915.t1